MSPYRRPAFAFQLVLTALLIGAVYVAMLRVVEHGPLLGIVAEAEPASGDASPDSGSGAGERLGDSDTGSSSPAPPSEVSVASGGATLVGAGSRPDRRIRDDASQDEGGVAATTWSVDARGRHGARTADADSAAVGSSQAGSRSQAARVRSGCRAPGARAHRPGCRSNRAGPPAHARAAGKGLAMAAAKARGKASSASGASAKDPPKGRLSTPATSRAKAPAGSAKAHASSSAKVRQTGRAKPPAAARAKAAGKGRSKRR